MQFKNAEYVYSQFGSTSVFFMNPKNLKMVVSKLYFRDRSDTMPLPNQNGFTSLVYTAGQLITNNKSRLAVVHL